MIPTASGSEAPFLEFYPLAVITTSSILTRGGSWLVGWLVEFYGISTFVGYLTPNPFYENSSISNNSV